MLLNTLKRVQQASTAAGPKVPRVRLSESPTTELTVTAQRPLPPKERCPQAFQHGLVLSAARVQKP